MARIIDGAAMNMVGDKIRMYRINKKLSQQALSDRLETMAILVHICSLLSGHIMEMIPLIQTDLQTMEQNLQLITGCIK